MDPLMSDLLVRVIILLAGAGLGAIGYHFRRGNQIDRRVSMLESDLNSCRLQVNQDRESVRSELLIQREKMMPRGEAVARFRVLEDMQRSLARIEERVDRLTERS